MIAEQAFEQRRLAEVKEIIEVQLCQLRKEAEEKESGIVSGKLELREETSHSISNLWSADDFEQLVELSQYATMVSESIASYESTIKRIGQLEQQRSAPYFARIDFRLDHEENASNVYIGRFSLMDHYNMLVYDWRAPIAGLFYRFGLGAASYQAPLGEISGEITLKRQYEIKNGLLEYFFDADIEILDEFLRKLLAQNASPQMKNIVETIQRDQDAVIRDMENDVLMVQGVAGSGKTSIALHRAAYLMYTGLAHRLTSQNIAILSPHNLFEQYIANVLPELGEENISSFLLDELLETVLKTSAIQTKAQLFEALITNASGSAQLMKSSLELKTSKAFMQILNALLPPKGRPLDMLAVYKDLFADKERFFQLARGVSLPDNIEDILRFTLENLQGHTLFFDDASALAYLHVRYEGYDQFRHIRQVVIDEAQEYYPMHFELFRLLFPNARFTILGDIYQTIEKPESIAFYEDIKSTLGKRINALITLDKSFRSTNEILQFSARFVDAPIKAFGRQGQAPQIYRLDNEESLDSLLQEIQRCKEIGYRSIGIICKSEKDCLGLHGRLSMHTEVSHIRNTSSASLTGVFILPVYLSKGMEFDAALIWDVDAAHYATQEDRRLLYIACTRALHRLSLYYYGTISRLLG